MQYIEGSARKDVYSMRKWKVGDICYFITNAREVNLGIITSISYDFCIIKYGDDSALRLRRTKFL